MASGKHITRIIVALTALAAVLCLIATPYASALEDLLGGRAVSMDYETKLFDTSEIIELNIIMDDEDWETMLSNAMSEEYYVCDVVVNGTKFKNVAIRPKGNTSLANIVMDPDSDRFSMKLEFDHFVDGQTCFGLDKLILNNNYADATCMKEALIYDMYRYLGVDASLYNYAKVSVNGNYRGVYLALEGVEQSFMMRNYGTQDGELYKPETFDFGGGADPNEKVTDSGADLNYNGDDLDKYSNIWDYEITATNSADHKRVVNALKNINEGNDIETYMDIDNILKYMAVHIFAVNMDSLSGGSNHNYYLYEYNGQLNIIPWDYNLSLGGMGFEPSATSVINDAIDSPFPMTRFFNALLKNDEYLAQYHDYLQMLTDEYVNGGRFDETYARIRSQIDTLVAEDPTAFYTAEEYEAAADMLYTVIKLRAESIDGQLSGEIPSTNMGQSVNPSKLIDGSDIDVSVMGVMSFDNWDDDIWVAGQAGQADQGMPGAPPAGDFDPANMPADFDFGDIPEGFAPGDMPGGAAAGTATAMPGLITLAVCFTVAAVALAVISRVKPKN